MNENPPPSRFPTFLRLFGWLFSVRFLRVVLVLAGLVVLFYAEENFRGRRAWKAYVREQTAKGEKLNLEEFIPPAVPDDQNLALCPLLRPVLDFERGPAQVVRRGLFQRVLPGPVIWRDTNGIARVTRLDRSVGADSKLRERAERQSVTNGWTDLAGWQAAYRAGTNLAGMVDGPSPAADVLAALRRLDADLDALAQEAARRPLCRWPVRYELDRPWSILLPHLAHSKRIVSLLQLRAAARLAAGDTAGGLADIHLGQRLAESVRDDPFLISQLVRLAGHNLMLQPLKEGLARHQFSDAQLADLQVKLRAADLLAAYAQAMRAERTLGIGWERKDRRAVAWEELFADGDGADGTAALGLLFRFAPSGWIYQNQLNLCRLHDRFTLPAVDVKARRVFPAVGAEADEEIKSHRGLFHVLPALLFPATTSSVRRFAYAQTQLDLAGIACALERQRLAHGAFPDSLAALTPRFLDKLPPDAFTGQPLSYRRSADGTYRLYSVGWNGTDDGGAEVKTKSGQPDQEKGDWVWKLPSPPDAPRP
jgi:hypothetical protein